MKVKIAHLYYDLMNLYGEQGNIIALKESLKNQNIETEIDLLSIGDDINFKDYDIFYIGTGSKESLLLTLEDIKKYTKDIPLNYFYKELAFLPMHENTKALMEELLIYYRDHTDKEAFKYFKNIRKKKLYCC